MLNTQNNSGNGNRGAIADLDQKAVSAIQTTAHRDIFSRLPWQFQSGQGDSGLPAQGRAGSGRCTIMRNGTLFIVIPECHIPQCVVRRCCWQQFQAPFKIPLSAGLIGQFLFGQATLQVEGEKGIVSPDCFIEHRFCLAGFTHFSRASPRRP